MIAYQISKDDNPVLTNNTKEARTPSFYYFVRKSMVNGTPINTYFINKKFDLR